jgi:phosphohistidine swiveling domain-containing protein
MKTLHILDPTIDLNIAPERLGGKGANLLRLQKLGLPVPPFVVIPHDVLAEQIPDNLTGTTLTEHIQNFNFPSNLSAQITAHFPSQTAYFAVRSSAQNEDGSAHSFAGQFETKLYITPEQLPEAIRAVWRSAFSTRVQAYAQERAVDKPVGISIIIQAMIPAEVAGVGFGIHPTEGDRNAKVISAVYGLGEGLVSGELDADTFIVRNGQIETQIAPKPFGLFYLPEHQAVEKVAISSAQQALPTLNQSQVHLIAAVLDQLRYALGQPQDIEFAFANGAFYLLQTRPVTNLNRLTDRSGHRMVWDNSNIIESYPGVTTPLTFSFIIRMYEAVYRQLGDLLGVPQKTIDDNHDAFANMLGLIRGRVYYNLESWYRTLSLVPGYKINARFMETMMGVKERFDLPEEKTSRTKAWAQLLVAIFKMLRSLIRLPAERRRFKQTLDRMIADYNALDFERLTPYETMERYLYFEDFLVKRWKAPLVNDFFAMIYFGLLKKQSEKLDPAHPNLHNDLLAGSRDIVSTEPVRRILEITALVLDREDAATFFKENTPETLLKNVERWPEIQAKIEAYLHDFGERTVGELKLETITYRQEPTAFFAIIQSYVQQGIRKRLSNEEAAIRQHAEDTVAKALFNHPIKNAFFNFLIKKTRILVSARENLRYERTRGFGMVRRMFLGIGQQFYAEHILEQPRDIFYLTRDEIFDFIKGTSVSVQIKEIVAQRKAEYAGFESETPPAERITTYGIVYHANDFSAPPVSATDMTGDTLQGLGCSAGIVRGRVRVVMRPDETPSLNGDILVTSSTDPGWVTLFPSASAILVERGSLLSHSAIVSRELGIPCIVGISGLLQRLKSGDEVEMNGTTGVVKILTSHA